MIIRRATQEDIIQLTGLFDQYRVFYGKDSALEEAKDFLNDRICQGDSQIYVAVEDDLLIGFVQLYPLFSSTRMKRAWLLNDLFVHEKHRGKRISVALIDKAKALCIDTKACSLTLETTKSNIIGNKLYPSAGFTLDEKHNYYEWSAQ